MYFVFARHISPSSLKYMGGLGGRDRACLDILPKSRALRGDGTRWQWMALCWNPCAFAMRVVELEFEDVQREGLDGGADRVPYVVWS